MLTLTAAGKSPNDALTLVKNAASGNESFKILIDGPAQVDTLKKFLDSQGYSVVIEDDEGTLYLSATKPDAPKPTLIPPGKTKPTLIPHSLGGTPLAEGGDSFPGTIGVIITCRKKDCNSSFIRKFLLSLLKVSNKPSVIALLDSAVKLAAYNSPACVTLKKLEAEGVQVLISESCADRLGITEAAGAGIIADMAEILDGIFSCGKIVSI